ncbi:hypothetical protein [Cloacibacterium caeni]|jgi:hypothetical protein|uniref:hypothetical protein n=1 Tax=Cloacibacterium caeni TaxID=2004710 RepID=UPI001BD0BB47|nr:hypothetical protein [Cloacibacterium caeni]
MKSAISFILSSIIFLASFQNSLFYVDYQINTEFYETYCINKQKPELDCNGKCQVKKATEQSQNPASQIKYAFELNILPSKPIETEIKNPFSLELKTKKFSYNHIFTLDGYTHILPDPPKNLA